MTMLESGFSLYKQIT